MRRLSPVVASGGHSSSWCTGLSPSRPLLLRSTGSRRAGSVIVAHGPSCSTACGIFPDQGSNPCPLHWQADSQPLRHQGSPSAICFCCKAWRWFNYHIQFLKCVHWRCKRPIQNHHSRTWDWYRPPAGTATVQVLLCLDQVIRDLPGSGGEATNKPAA